VSGKSPGKQNPTPLNPIRFSIDNLYDLDCLRFGIESMKQFGIRHGSAGDAAQGFIG